METKDTLAPIWEQITIAPAKKYCVSNAKLSIRIKDTGHSIYVYFKFYLLDIITKLTVWDNLVFF